MTEASARLVVDASAIGALIFREPEAGLLERKLAGRSWVAPSLIDYEVGSIYLKKRKTYPGLITELESCFQIYSESALERVEVDISAVSAVAEKHHLTIYDASYFWLAETLNLDLLTLDKELLSAWLSK